jgi:hypothetical protein
VRRRADAPVSNIGCTTDEPWWSGTTPELEGRTYGGRCDVDTLYRLSRAPLSAVSFRVLPRGHTIFTRSAGMSERGTRPEGVAVPTCQSVVWLCWLARPSTEESEAVSTLSSRADGGGPAAWARGPLDLVLWTASRGADIADRSLLRDSRRFTEERVRSGPAHVTFAV